MRRPTLCSFGSPSQGLEGEPISFGLVQLRARDWLKKMDWQELLHIEARRRVFQAHSQIYGPFPQWYSRDGVTHQAPARLPPSLRGWNRELSQVGDIP